MVSLYLYRYHFVIYLTVLTRPLNEDGSRVAPEMWTTYRLAYEFTFPICLCGDECAVFAVRGANAALSGKWVSACRTRTCGYFGTH